MHCIANLVLVEQAIKIIRVCNLFAVHAQDYVSDCEVTILSLGDASQTSISCGLAWRDLQDDYAVSDRQIKLALQRCNIAGANSQFWPAHFAGF